MQDFEDFVALRSQALLRTAYLLCGGDKDAAEDILQDVLMSMYGKWRRIESSPEAYARTSLANAAANRWRRRSRKPEAPLALGAVPTARGHEQQVVDADSVVRALARVPIGTGSEPGRGHWLLVRRSISDPGEIAYYPCYGPCSRMPGWLSLDPLPQSARAQGMIDLTVPKTRRLLIKLVLRVLDTQIGRAHV